MKTDPALSVNETLRRHPGMVPLLAAAGMVAPGQLSVPLGRASKAAARGPA